MVSIRSACTSWSATTLAIALTVTAAACGGSRVVGGTGGGYNDSGVGGGSGTGGSPGSGGAGGSSGSTGGIATSGGVAGGLASGGDPAATGGGGGRAGDTASGGRIAAGGGGGTAGAGGSIASGGSAPVDAGTDTAAPTEWLRQFGTKADDEARAVAMDSSGNVYVAGRASGDLGGKPSGPLPGQTSVGSVDAYLRKYSASGVEQWTRQFGSTGADYAYAAAVDGMGNVYVGGWTGGTLPGQTSAGGADVFLRKYDANAVEQWTRQFGSQGDDHAYSVSVDSIGNVYFVGDLAATLPDQTGPIASFLRKYDPSGTEKWTQLIAADADTYAQSVTVGGDDAVYVGGYVNRGTLPGQIIVGLQDAFLRKYNGSGTEQWTRQFGSTIADIGRSVAVDGSGNVYVAGYSFDDSAPSMNSATFDAFLTKYDANGAQKWTRRSGLLGYELNQSVAVDSSGNIYVGGYSERDALLTKYDGGGTAIWTRSIASLSGVDVGFAVGVSSNGKFCIAGYTQSVFSGQTSAGRLDAFVQVFVQ